MKWVSLEERIKAYAQYIDDCYSDYPHKTNAWLRNAGFILPFEAWHERKYAEQHKARTKLKAERVTGGLQNQVEKFSLAFRLKQCALGELTLILKHIAVEKESEGVELEELDRLVAMEELGMEDWS